MPCASCYDLGLNRRADLLDTIGVQAREWALVGRNGNDVYAEPRGLLAGYRWPQYAVHRGQLQMLLYRAVLERLGPAPCGWASVSPAIATTPTA
jgi:5-methylphenazine-1-carboxylate 1-monooxygenase